MGELANVGYHFDINNMQKMRYIVDTFDTK